MEPKDLDPSVTARLPVRYNKDNRYFTDVYQAMPLHGFTALFSKMLDHPNIHLMLNTDYKDLVNIIPHKKLVYTGPIDEFFDYEYGKLPYRSIDFQFQTLETDQYQSTATINFPNEHLYTRITEFKQLTGQQHHKTTIVFEYPNDEGDPYYPVPKPENTELLNKYRLLIKEVPDTYFVGRLATYRYYNMDQVVAQALTLFKKLFTPQEEKLIYSERFHIGTVLTEPK